MKIFIDTNVLLDVVGKRDDVQLRMDALRVLQIARAMQAELFMSVLSVSTIFYVLRRMDADSKKGILVSLTKEVKMLSCKVEHAECALAGKFTDLEDAMQYACAFENGCNLIITRDGKDFANSEIPVMSPSEFIKAASED